jgi:hypothetical protein
MRMRNCKVLSASFTDPARPRLVNFARAVGAALVAWGIVVLPVPGFAFTVSSAKMASGVVEIQGRNATPNATISWEGQTVASATSRGAFRFATSALPAGCLGELSDGSETIHVALQGCRIRASGSSGTLLALHDAKGAKVGDLVGIENPGAIYVAFAFADRLVVLKHVSGDRFSGTASLVYESSDCSGIAYVAIANAASIPFPLVAVGRPGPPHGGPGDNLIVEPDPSQPIRTITARSYVDGTTNRCATDATDGVPIPGILVRAGRALLDMDALFTPPFHVR